ncbi:hypothetical protein SAMN05192550_0168 [Flavobacterium glycines]|uniref:Uncharacterized protein n=1 Tax=Flavobacterium glycines TaxID=551990 RepID=A0A1B9DPU5_9FLAO|nr:hypothetical protein [Flavobacterium glycines]OCB71729.1 hypothetical protein FBGL_10980 [Flavobacterium glycines]GEL10781.1 hypothetical protein FGL01_15200 [Flavobacterium glycines]SDI54601.1 hypothetical protein SAMN05192550_0168 [Flavobacterium glycines]
MPEEKKITRVDIRLEAETIINDYVEIVQNSCNMLAFITSNLKNIPFDEIPSPPVLGYFEFNKINYVGDKKIYLDMWLFNHGINDIIKGLNLSMARANYLLDMTKLEGKTMLYGEYVDFEKRINKKFLKKDLPTLISLTSEIVSKPLILTDEILSINNCRKCLEHRNGIVTEIDTNIEIENNKKLKIKWIGTRLTVLRNGEMQMIDKTGFSLNKGEEIQFSHLNENKTYDIGERLRIDMKTFYELSYTGYLYVKHIADNFNFGNK